jgi:hypothetical protein
MMSLSHTAFENYNKKSKAISTALEFFFFTMHVHDAYLIATQHLGTGLICYVLHYITTLIQDIYGYSNS